MKMRAKRRMKEESKEIEVEIDQLIKIKASLMVK